MKRFFAVLCATLMLSAILSGCGTAAEAEKTADLDKFYTTAAESYNLDETSMVDVTDDLMESYYPGLKDIPHKQLIAKMPAMSSVVSEYVLMECETEEDAQNAAAILQTRVDDQAGGGAWYPESMESWGNAQVLTNGRYVAMIASAEHQSNLADDFNALFA